MFDWNDTKMDKVLQIVVFIVLMTMPLWAGYVLNLNHNGPLIEIVGDR